jgi:hypothetical protein
MGKDYNKILRFVSFCYQYMMVITFLGYRHCDLNDFGTLLKDGCFNYRI